MVPYGGVSLLAFW